MGRRRGEGWGKQGEGEQHVLYRPGTVLAAFMEGLASSVNRSTVKKHMLADT